MSNARNIASGAKFVDTAGDTMTGDLTVNKNSGAILTIETDDTNQATLLFKEGGVSKYNVAHVGSSDTFQVWNYTTNTRALGIDNASRVTMPSQPFFSCKLNSQTSTSGGTVKLNSWVSLGSHGGLGSHFANSKFTAPVAGNYLFNYSGLHHSGATSGGYSRAYTYVNGAVVIDGLGDEDTEGPYQRLAYSVILNLSANDYVEIYCNAGHSSAFIYNYYTTWSGYLLG